MTGDSLPDPDTLQVVQTTRALDEKCLERVDHLMVVLPAINADLLLSQLPYGDTLRAALRRASDLKAVPAARVTIPNARNTSVSIATLPASASAFDELGFARTLSADALSANPTTVAATAPDNEYAGTQRLLLAIVAAMQAAAFELPSFKSTPKPVRRIRTLKLLGHGQRIALQHTDAQAAGNNLARWLTALPPNKLTVPSYVARLRSLAHTNGWKMRFLDERKLKAKNAGAFLAVSQAGHNGDSGIVHLQYQPDGRKNGQRRLALVGKGVCFDTGGVNLKPFGGMLHMQYDMEGSAVALGALLALTRMKVDFPIDCWLALAENQIGPGAYKTHDVVEACNGTSIEVIHTDAEGRMILADTLALAARRNPGLIIDFATLTGTCVAALTSRYSGIFTNQPHLHPMLTQAGVDSGERVWPFPIDPDFDDDLKSPVADVRQCSVETDGDHIHAARFLKRFVPDNIPWLHMDMSAGHNKGGLAHIPTAITGFGVRYTVHLLLNSEIFNQLGKR